MDLLLLRAVAEQEVALVAGELGAGLLAQVVQAGEILTVQHHREVAARRRERQSSVANAPLARMKAISTGSPRSTDTPKSCSNSCLSKRRLYSCSRNL